MDRIEKIARRVATVEVVAASFFAGARPSDMFAGAFFDAREKVKSYKTKLEDQASAFLQKSLINDLKSRGIKIQSFKLSLGQYRGSRFVTSAKLSVVTGDGEKAEKLLKYLQTKYSPKYKLKGFDEKTRIASYNVR